MTRIAVFSDTHGTFHHLAAALDAAGKVDAFLHLGDRYPDADKIAALLPVPFYTVRGNCDCGMDAPRKRIVTFENAPLLMVHGDAFYSTVQLADLAEQNHCKAALFGHTHIPLLTAQGALLVINPGSLSLPRGGSRPSFAVLTIHEGDVDVKMIAL